jgi:cytochrome c oxidase assembly protein subunit 15
LAAHLGIAFIILGFLTWFILLLGRTENDLLLQRRAREERLFSISTGLLHLAFLQILFGALVAGIDAGRNYTDWPLMAGGFFPPEPFSTTPLWRNFFEDDGLVQFMHRIAGYVLLLFGFLVWRKSKSSGNDKLKFAFNAVMAAMAFQVILGVMTVLHAAPWNLAILHQLGAVLLWVLILRARFLSGYPPQQQLTRE